MLLRLLLDWSEQPEVKKKKGEEEDHGAWTQAFARHRRAAKADDHLLQGLGLRLQCHWDPGPAPAPALHYCYNIITQHLIQHPYIICWNDQAKAILSMAKREMEEEKKVMMKQEIVPQVMLDPGLSMKRSLQRFLQKRKVRIHDASASPYAAHANLKRGCIT